VQLVGGKLDRRPEELHSLGGLVFLQDQVTKQKFLVDTGASVSVLPHSAGTAATGPPLSGADGKPIASWGKVTKKLFFGAQSFFCSFLLAAVSKPILGVDFLAAHRLLVDPGTRTVLYASTLKPVGDVVAAISSRFVAAVEHIAPAVRELLSRFPKIVGDGKGTPRPLHGVSHFIETTGRPVFAKARRLEPDKLKIAEAEFRSLEAAGIVRRSNSPWSSPLHMVPKPDGSWRPCGDYRRLNTITVQDRYPLPSIPDLSAKLHGCKVFSCVDLIKGYHQVPMAEDDIQKTAIVTPFGLFEYVFMPFGLANAAQTFQRLMDRLFRQLGFVFTYLDDHLIASKSMEEHLLHLEQFFLVLQENGLTINPAKCVFAVSSLKFLGHMVDETGIRPLPKHVTAVQGVLPPTDIKQLQRFSGMINFYRRFLPGIAKVLRPLTDLLRGSPKVLAWPPEAAAAFVAAKAAIIAAVPLSHPAPDAVLSLAVDASDTHVGGVFQQKTPQGWQPLAFFSQKLSPAESKYSTFDRELLAAYAAIRHFRFMLEGRQFRLYTDHKPLVTAMVRVSPPWTGRQQRHLAYISEFTTDLEYTPGKENVVADAMSRPTEEILVAAADITAAGVVPPLDIPRLAAAQLECPDVEAMRKSTVLSVTSHVVGGQTLFGDVSTGKFRPFLPAAFRADACAALHGLHHPGIRGTKKLLCASFCWPGISKDAGLFARNCLQCQRGKIHRHITVQAAHVPVPIRRFAHIHVDLVGPLPVSANCNYLFTVVDRTTRWPEAIPMSSTTAADCATALLQGWIQRFGVPDTITSDRGPQFTSALWAAVCSLLSIQHTQTTAYHPQSNGLVERFHRRLKDALQARAAGADWHAHLPWIMLGVRSAWREDAEFTPAEAVFGSQPVLPGQFLSAPEPPSPTFLQEFQGVLAGRAPLPTAHHNTVGPQVLPEELLLARFVLVRRDGVQPPLSALYDGPYLVLERSLHFFKLQVGPRTDTISTHRLKVCYSPPDVEAALPPRRGRPPGRQPGLPATSGDLHRTPPATSGVSPAPALKRVGFVNKPVVVQLPPPSSATGTGRPRRTVRRPDRYT
jgi:cleavage and polyadenylation specificity factor subunit 1